ncbi:hypothetical protein [Streptomyces mirabilis]
MTSQVDALPARSGTSSKNQGKRTSVAAAYRILAEGETVELTT